MRQRAEEKTFLYSYRFVVLLAAVIALLVMLPSLLRFDGVFLIRGDYLEQYLTRMITARRMLMDGSLSMWDWTAFLGEPYNNLTSVLSLDVLCLVVPDNWFLPVTTLGNVLRFSFAAVTACAYLRRFVSEKSACLGGLLYAFSSYSLEALEFAQFNNAVAAFPLLLLGIELLFTQEKYRHFLVLAVFLNAHLNPYLFVQSSIFLLIYALIRFLKAEEWQARRSARFIVWAFFDYLIGGLLAGISISQFFAIVFSAAKFTGRVDELGLMSFVKLLVPTDLLDVLVGLTSAGASNRFDTFGRDTRWLSFAAWVPMFGSCLWAVYLRRHQGKDSISLCVGVSLLMAGLPLFNNLFNLYTAHYSRWWYCLIMMLVLASMQAWEELDAFDSVQRRWSLYVPWAVLGGVILLSEVIFPLAAGMTSGLLGKMFSKLARNTGELDTERVFQIFSLSITLIGTVLTAVLYERKQLRRYALMLVSAFLVLYGSSYVLVNNTEDHLMDHAPESTMTLDDMVEGYLYSSGMDYVEETYSYRIDCPPQLGNYGTAHGYASVSAFNSEVNHASARASWLLGYENGGEDVRWWLSDPSNAVRTLLSVRYYFDYHPEDAALYPVPDGFVFVQERKGTRIYENENFLSMGFAYDSYIPRSQLVDGEDAALIMLHALVVEDANVECVKQYLEPWDGELLDVAEVADMRRGMSCTDFEGRSSGFAAEITTENACVVYFSVPHTNGWAATVDGVESKILTVNGGFMAVAVKEGTHHIRFSYVNPSLRYGFGAMALGLLLGGYLLIRRKGFGDEK